jgi:hypothetical protein
VSFIDISEPIACNADGLAAASSLSDLYCFSIGWVMSRKPLYRPAPPLTSGLTAGQRNGNFWEKCNEFSLKSISLGRHAAQDTLQQMTPLSQLHGPDNSERSQKSAKLFATDSRY